MGSDQTEQKGRIRSGGFPMVTAALLGGAAVLGIVIAISSPDARSVMSRPAVHDSEAEQVGARLTALEERLDKVVLLMENQAYSSSSARGRSAPLEPEDAQTTEELRQSYRRQEQELASTFQSERTDPAWSATAESELRRIGSRDAILGIEAAPPRKQTIDCRSTRCRIEFEFADAADADDWTVAFLTGVGGTLKRNQYFVTRNADGSATVRLYGQR